ncbi:hypothetical protein Tco_0948855 [Tanacetum coccineum]
MAESAKRHKENSNIIEEIRASTNVAIRNQGFTIIDGDDVTKDVVLGMKFCKKYSSCQMIMKKFALGDKCERIMEDE